MSENDSVESIVIFKLREDLEAEAIAVEANNIRQVISRTRYSELLLRLHRQALAKSPAKNKVRARQSQDTDDEQRPCVRGDCGRAHVF